MFNFFKNNPKPPAESEEPKDKPKDERRLANLKIYERRKAIRVRAELPARFWILRKDKTPLEPGVSAKTANLSINGAMIVVERREFLLEGSFLNLRFTLPGEDLAYAQGIIIRTKYKAGYDPRYEIAVQFTEMKNVDQKKIMKYIFSKQLELRKTRRG